MAAEIRSMLVCTTAHLTVATLAYLNETPESGWPFSADPISYGFILYAHDERPDACPDDIWALCVRARELGADYIKLDCDAEPVDGLEVYDHDAADAPPVNYDALARFAGFTVTASQWTATGGATGQSWIVTAPTGERWPDDYASEADAWAAAAKWLDAFAA